MNNLRTWLEVDQSALKHNYEQFKQLLKPSTKLMAVVKSNAYGHGLVEVGQYFEGIGADWLGVDSVVEAYKLRQVGIQCKVLVFGYIMEKNFEQAVIENISITVSNFDVLDIITKLKVDKKIKVHIKIDSGMHRQGFQISEIDQLIMQLEKNADKLVVEGVYTHFASAKKPNNSDSTSKQIEIFESACEILKAAGYDFMRHGAATGGTIVYPQAHYDMVRIGIGLYGLWPSGEVRQQHSTEISLAPALSWKTIIAEVKTVQRGESIGYDLTHTFKRDSRVAILPIGYWHGYDRELSNRAEVLVRGQRVAVVGRVSMDMVTIDVTDIVGVESGDEVVLLGRQGDEVVSADELAAHCQTINYEIVTRLNPRVKRVLK